MLEGCSTSARSLPPRGWRSSGRSSSAISPWRATMSSSWARSRPGSGARPAKVLLFGVGMALVFLITFAVIATQLLKVTGPVFAGGLLLLWVAYNMWRATSPARGRHRRRSLDQRRSKARRASKTLLQAAIADHHRRPQHEPRQCAAGCVDRARQSGLAVHRPHLFGPLHGACCELRREADRSAITGSITSAWPSSCRSRCNMIYEGWVGGEQVLGLRSVLGLG